MLQGKNKRKQNKAFRRVKALSLLLSFILILAIGNLLYAKFISPHPLFLSPLSLKQNAPVQISNYLDKRKINFTKIEEESDFYKIVLKDESVVFISKNKNIEQQLTSLQLIQDRLKIEGKVFKSLDLRFDQPVIKL